jgi:hypothetical protein
MSVLQSIMSTSRPLLVTWGVATEAGYVLDLVSYGVEKPADLGEEVGYSAATTAAVFTRARGRHG